MTPEQVVSELRSALANVQYIVGCLPHDDAHRSSLEQARQAIKTIESVLVDAPQGTEPVTDAMVAAARNRLHLRGAAFLSDFAIREVLEDALGKMETATPAAPSHDYPACAVFRGGKCTCDEATNA